VGLTVCVSLRVRVRACGVCGVCGLCGVMCVGMVVVQACRGLTINALLIQPMQRAMRRANASLCQPSLRLADIGTVLPLLVRLLRTCALATYVCSGCGGERRCVETAAVCWCDPALVAV
jgi:hypothetical protein